MDIEMAPRQSQITAIVRQGVGHQLMEMLHSNDIVSGSLHRVRGTGINPMLGSASFGTTMEWDMLTVLVPETDANDWFQTIFVEGDIDRPHGGFIYMHSLGFMTPFQLPEMEGSNGENL